MKFINCKIVFGLLTILSIAISHINSNHIGLKAALSMETIRELQLKILPDLLLMGSGEGVIPNTHLLVPGKEADKNGSWFDYTSYAGTPDFVLDVKNIKLDLKGLKPENVVISPSEGDSVLVIKANNINISGTLDFAVQYGVPYSDEGTKITVKNANVTIKLRLGMVLSEEHKLKKKHVINAEPIDLIVDIKNEDVEFEFQGYVLYGVQNLIRSYLAEQLITNVQSNLKDTIIPMLKSIIQNQVQAMPIYTPIYTHPTNGRQIFLDYSLIDRPRIQDNELLIINIDGRCVQKGDQNDKSDYPKSTGVLPKISNAPKGLKVLVSQFTLNTFFYSLFYTDFFIYKYETGDLLGPGGPLEEVKEKGLIDKILGSVNPQNVLRKSIVKHYGPEPNILVDVAATEAPQIEMMNGEITSNIKLHLALSAKEFDRKTKLIGENLVTFAGFQTECKIKATASVKEGGRVSFEISEIKLVSFSTILNQMKTLVGRVLFKNRVKNVTDEVVLRKIINSVLKTYRKATNEQYKNGKEFKFQVEGLKLENSTAKLISDFIEFEWAVKFVNSRLKRTPKGGLITTKYRRHNSSRSTLTESREKRRRRHLK